MQMTILEKIRKLNWILQESPAGTFSFGELCQIMSDMMESNVYLANKAGKVISARYKIRSDSSTITDPAMGTEKFPNEYNDAFMQVMRTTPNLKAEEALEIFKYDYETYDKLHTIVPVFGGGERVGTLILTRYEPPFTDEDLAIAEYGATVIGLEIQRQLALQAEVEERNRAVVKMAITTLSYSEVEALQQIFAELEGNEGLLVASRIADKFGITRSVIVNGLRKLESAGLLESRSLGMKGTYIKVLNENLLHEIGKMEV